MLIRRKNWPAFAMIAVFGPLLGAFVAMKIGPLGLCSGEKDVSKTTKHEKVGEDASEADTHQAKGTLQLPDGDRVALDEIAPERTVAVVVMKGPWCPVCQRQLKRLSKQLHEVQAANASVVGLTTAEPERNRQLMEQLGLQFPVLSDTSKSLHRRLGMWRTGACHAIPGVVFLDESGEVVKIHRGRYPGKPQDEFVLDTLRALSQ